MPRVSQMYPSKWLAAADLDEQDLIVTIAGIAQETLGDDAKWVLYFEDQEKGLVLNKTNTRTIAGLYGDDTDDWVGQQITLYPTWVDFQGKQTEAIRVRPKQPRKNKPQPVTAGKGKTAPPVTQAEADADPDQEDIPF